MVKHNNVIPNVHFHKKHIGSSRGPLKARLALDQASKLWIEANLAFRVDQIEVIPGFLSIVHAQNPGAAFGLLGGFGNRHAVFLLFTLFALYIVVVKGIGVGRVETAWGLYFFTACILASLAISTLTKRR